MLNFTLSTEIACDLSQEQAKEKNIDILPMSFFVNDIPYSTGDGKMDTKELCALMRSGAKTRTSQPNEYEAEEFLKKQLAKGKDVLHISFSGGMSGTAETMTKVAEKLNKDSKNKIYVVDSLCQSAGVALLLYMVYDKAEKENLTAVQAKEYAEQVRLRVVHCFVVDSLTYLARGGRVSQKSAFIGNLINIKPVLHLNDEGKIVLLQKVFGRNRSIKSVLNRFKQYYNGLSNTVFITHADCIEEAESVKEELLKINPNLTIYLNNLGPLITCHSGPGTLAIYFTTDSREDA